jgi:hypothetical protein
MSRARRLMADTKLPHVVEPSATTSITPVSPNRDTIHSDGNLQNPDLLGHVRKPSLVTSVASSHGDVHTGKSWAQLVEDPWLPLLLTLDGGGIRGYSSLLILERLMYEVARWETLFEEELPLDQRRSDPFDAKSLLPCHYFDYMYGTSTGGLIATMLGRLRMNIPDCLHYYRKFGNDLFGSKRSPIPLATKYRHKPLEEAVKEIVRKHCPIHTTGCTGADWHPWHLDYAGDEPNFLDGMFKFDYPIKTSLRSASWITQEFW